MAQIPADPLAWGAPAGAVEVLERRRQNAKHFRHADDPSNYTAVFGGVLHYEPTPGQGAWEDSDTTLRADGVDHLADHLPFSIRRTGINLDLTDRATGKGIRYSLPTQNVTISGNKILFNWNNIDWTYEVVLTGIKLSGVVSTPQGARTLTFPFTRLGTAAAPTILPDGSVQGDGYTLPRPYAVWADGITRTQCGAWSFFGQNQLRFSWDDSVLPPEAYPYILDPSTSFINTATGQCGRQQYNETVYPPTVPSAAEPDNFYPERGLYGGGTNYAVSPGLVRWDTSSILDRAVVTAAEFRAVEELHQADDARSGSADWYDFGGTIDTADWTITAGTNAYAGKLISTMGTVDAAYPLLSPAANVNKTGFTGLRWHVSGGQPTGQNWYGWKAFAVAAAGFAPRLIVTYTDPTDAIPISDVSAGGWSASGGGTLASMVDEAVADDADYAQSALGPSSDTAEVLLSAMPAAASATSHALKIRRRKDAAGGQDIDLTVSLRRGASEVLDTQTLSGIDENWTEIDQVINFSGARDDLRVRLVANYPGTGTLPNAAPTIVGAGSFVSTATNAATLTPGLPSGWAATDIHILIAARGDNTVMTSLAGWTQIAALSANNTIALRTEVWWRRAVVGDTAPTITFGSSTIVRCARIIGIRGCPTGSSPFDTQSISNNAASATVTFGTITPTVDNTLLLALFSYEDDPNNASALSGFGAFDVQGTTAGNDMDLAHASRSYPTGGVATGALTSTVSGGSFANSVNTGILIALSGSVPATRRAQVSWIELEEVPTVDRKPWTTMLRQAVKTASLR